MKEKRWTRDRPVEPEGPPRRFQRKRTSGYRLPEGIKTVTRPGPFGNPFDTAEQFGKVLRKMVRKPGEAIPGISEKEYQDMRWIALNLFRLKGKHLACFCPLEDVCHADILLKMANPTE